MRKKLGFTLIEVLISASVFSVIFLLGTQVYISAIKQSQVSTLNASFDNSVQIFLSRLDDFMTDKKVDYNEYFVQCHKAGDCPFVDFEITGEDEVVNFGKHEGLYYAQFWDFGLASNGEADKYGYSCTDGNCNLGIIDSTVDEFNGSFGTGSNTNAFCLSQEDRADLVFKEASLNAYETFDSTANCEDKDMVFKVLFLKSQDESHNFIIGNNDNKLKFLELTNKVPTFQDANETIYAAFNEDKSYSDLYDSPNYLNFDGLEISNFKVKIFPLENTNYAVSEDNWDQFQNPRVEIAFEIKPANQNLLNLLSRNFSLKVHKVYNLSR